MPPQHTPNEYDLLKQDHAKATLVEIKSVPTRMLTDEQIANYEMLRGRWDEKQKDIFVKSQEARPENL